MDPSVCPAVDAAELMEGKFLLAGCLAFRNLNSLMFSYRYVIFYGKGKQSPGQNDSEELEN